MVELLVHSLSLFLSLCVRVCVPDVRALGKKGEIKEVKMSLPFMGATARRQKAQLAMA